MSRDVANHLQGAIANAVGSAVASWSAPALWRFPDFQSGRGLPHSKTLSRRFRLFSVQDPNALSILGFEALFP
jgi:hypothetical protein